ncbi:hypothetical protein MKW98_031052 [Papaver atlanticum]|uniref:Uncharacterized protein n=1 Tax=Papaver atlanticum TaxID=357466 RepID=A0AAD4XL90_9MAGN|nr:hypothetical protein MKW98_031052 [Papaver atlanticum]
MDNGDVDKKFHPLDFGALPPWQLTVTLADGEKQYIKIPYSEGTHVVGLPLGLGVPEVIASHYKTLLCMVNGMTCHNQSNSEVRTTREGFIYKIRSFSFQAHPIKLFFHISQTPASPSKKRKLCTVESGPCDIEKPEHLPPPKSNDWPATPVLLVQESVIEENMVESDDLPLPRVKRSRSQDVPTSASLICSEKQTEKVESVAGVVPVRESVDATSTNCLTVGSATLSSSTPVDITPPPVESTSVSSPVGNEWFEYVENFKIPKVYTDLYKKISSKYGHMVTKKVIKSSYAMRLVCITSLIKIAYTMETVRGVDLSAVLLESWEGDIKVSETLQFNIKWLREIFGRLKSSWKTSFSIEEEVECHEKVLDAEQVNYVGLISRKDELEKELVDVKINIRKSEAKISSEREAIRKMMAGKYIFLFEPVLGNFYISSVITPSIAAASSSHSKLFREPSFPPAHMMDNEDVEKKFHPLDLGILPPWQITVTLADGGKQHIKIPYTEGTHVVGLPLGLDVPKVIAFNYKTLLCMVNGMTSIITNLTLKLERQQKVAARHLDKMNRYRLELEELQRTVDGGMAVLQVVMAPVSPSKKRKLSTEESEPCDTQAVCIEKPEHLPPPTSNDRPVIRVLLVQESVIEENMDESDGIPLTRVKGLRGENIPSSASLACSDVQTEKVESDAVVLPIGGPVDATMTSTSINCQTEAFDSTLLPTSTTIDIIPPVVESTSVSGQGEHEGLEYVQNFESDDLPLTSVNLSPGGDVPTSASPICPDVEIVKTESDAGVVPVGEPVAATLTSTYANGLTVDYTTLPISTPIDIIPPIVESTSISGQGEDEGFEDVDNLKLDDLPLSSMKRFGSKDVHASASLICSEVKTEKVASVAGALVVLEPVDATMTSTSANCLTPADSTLPLILSTSVSSRVGDEWFEYVDNFRIPKVYADLYKKIFSIYGHMATKKVIRSNDDILLAAVISLMKIVSRMETIRGVELGVALLESWEGDIGDAETLQFNIKWLRETFNTLKNSWKSSFAIDKEVESREQVLDATQVEYAGLRSRKDQLETELLELKTKIREFEGKISSEREAIHIKLAEKNIFLFEPVLRNLFNLEITN